MKSVRKKSKKRTNKTKSKKRSPKRVYRLGDSTKCKKSKHSIESSLCMVSSFKQYCVPLSEDTSRLFTVIGEYHKPSNQCAGDSITVVDYITHIISKGKTPHLFIESNPLGAKKGFSYNLNAIIESFHPSIITPIDIREPLKGKKGMSNIERISTKNVSGMPFSDFNHLLDESKEIHTMLNSIGSLPLVVRHLLKNIEGEILHYENWYKGELMAIKHSIKSFNEHLYPLSFLFDHQPTLFAQLQELYVRCADANVLYQFFTKQDTDHIILVIGDWHALNIEKLLGQYQVYVGTPVENDEYYISGSYF